jgi:uncharacterized repeat protein (TIGR03803 family)
MNMASMKKSDRVRVLFILFAGQVAIATGQTLQTLHSFQDSDGAEPLAGLVQGSDGNFYGTTSLGGSNGLGTAFKMTTNGVLTTLVSFDTNKGAYPCAGLIQANDGNFYGTTSGRSPQFGGLNIYGTIFKVTSNGTLTTLVTFTNSNGSHSSSGLVQASDGYLYGTAFGDANEPATLFRMTMNGTFTVLAFQASYEGSGSPLVQGIDGSFYGTTFGGGATADGTVFRLTTNGILTNLVSFYYGSSLAPAYPDAGLARGNDGNFYGTTAFGGGVDDVGTVFKITAEGVMYFLAVFKNTNGAIPLGELVQGNDGSFYGTTREGGSGYYSQTGDYSSGTVFKITPAGALTSLFSFNGTNGAYPEAKLVFGSDGNLYGTTRRGGANDWGTVFRLVMPGPPSLTIAQSNSSIIVSWLASAGDYQLEQATNLASVVSWFAVTQPFATNNGVISATIVTPADRKFFRLKK